MKKKIFKKYDELILEDNKAKEIFLRSEIKRMLDEYSEKDSNCYHLRGLIDYESDEWEMYIEASI